MTALTSPESDAVVIQIIQPAKLGVECLMTNDGNITVRKRVLIMFLSRPIQ